MGLVQAIWFRDPYPIGNQREGRIKRHPRLLHLRRCCLCPWSVPSIGGDLTVDDHASFVPGFEVKWEMRTRKRRRIDNVLDYPSSLHSGLR